MWLPNSSCQNQILCQSAFLPKEVRLLTLHLTVSVHGGRLPSCSHKAINTKIDAWDRLSRDRGTSLITWITCWGNLLWSVWGVEWVSSRSINSGGVNPTSGAFLQQVTTQQCQMLLNDIAKLLNDVYGLIAKRNLANIWIALTVY